MQGCIPILRKKKNKYEFQWICWNLSLNLCQGSMHVVSRRNYNNKIKKIHIKRLGHHDQSRPVDDIGWGTVIQLLKACPPSVLIYGECADVFTGWEFIDQCITTVCFDHDNTVLFNNTGNFGILGPMKREIPSVLMWEENARDLFHRKSHTVG